MGRFLLIFLAVAIAVALTTFLFGAAWSGFITGGVAGVLIVLSLRAKRGNAQILD